MSIVDTLVEIIKSVEITIGNDNIYKNGEPKPSKIRRPFKKPGDAWKLIIDAINDYNKYGRSYEN